MSYSLVETKYNETEQEVLFLHVSVYATYIMVNMCFKGERCNLGLYLCIHIHVIFAYSPT